MLSEDARKHPDAAMVQEALDEVQRINEVYWKILHFDRWSPFLNPAVGVYQDAGNVHQTMQICEDEWNRGQIGDELQYLANSEGNHDYAGILHISAAVGFQSHTLPEPYTGNWSNDYAALLAAPLLVSVDGGMDVRVHEERMQSLQM